MSCDQQHTPSEHNQTNPYNCHQISHSANWECYSHDKFLRIFFYQHRCSEDSHRRSSICCTAVWHRCWSGEDLPRSTVPNKFQFWDIAFLEIRFNTVISPLIWNFRVFQRKCENIEKILLSLSFLHSVLWRSSFLELFRTGGIGSVFVFWLAKW